MSKYVQRCLGCRRVCGKSSFRVFKTGGRSTVCRWCETSAVAQANDARAQLQPLLREQNRLVSALAKVRTKIRAKEAEILAAESTRPRLKAAS